MSCNICGTDGKSYCLKCLESSIGELQARSEWREMEESLKARINAIAEKNKTQWEEHFSRFYGTAVEGDAQKKVAVLMGIESLRDDLIRELGEKR